VKSNIRYSILALVTIAQAGASFIQQGIGSLGPFLTAEFDLTRAQLGLVFGMIMGGAALATAISGIAVDAYGERRMILVSGLVMGIAIISGALVHSYAGLIACMLFAGVGYAASTPAGGRAILLWFTRDRGIAMGIRQMGVPIGGFAGALLLPLLASVGGYRLALLFGGIVAIVPAVVATIWYRVPEGGDPSPRKLAALLQSMWDVARDPRLIFVTVTCSMLGCGQSNMLTFLVLTFVRDVHLGVALAGAALATAQVGATIGRLAWGFVSDRWFKGDRIVPLMCSAVLASVSAAAVPLVPQHSIAVAFALAFVLGMSASGWNGLWSAASVEIGGPERAGSALGLGLTGIFTMGLISPPLFGALADAHGFHVAWYALAAFLALGIIPGALAKRAIAFPPQLRRSSLK
jgi:MFS family permease